MAALMFQGTGSDVGKSVLTAGLCRAAANRGLSVAPFKPQNMSNNAAVAEMGDGWGEIGRAQWLQAKAARVAPTVHMNPVLLKPTADTRAQVVVQGVVQNTADSSDFSAFKKRLLEPVLESFELLRRQYDVVLVEGAGSPAETNLRSGDIANMGFALAADVPVVLIGDIDRGGVIASVVGTHAVLSDADKAQVAGFLINKFRGDPRLFDDGLAYIERRTSWPSFGVVPWLPAARQLPAEDAVVLDGAAGGSSGKVKIVVPMLSRIANFDDVDPLKEDPSVELQFIPPGTALPGDADCVILLGTKATLADLDVFRTNGWDVDLAAHVRRGGHVLGLCGGYQMLGQHVTDPQGADGQAGRVDGLGYLNIETTMQPEKTVRPMTGRALGQAIEGYEIHLGQTVGPDTSRPMVQLASGPDGAMSPSGQIEGCYLHGLFGSDGYRSAFLERLGAAETDHSSYWAKVNARLDALADHLEHHADVDRLLALAGA